MEGLLLHDKTRQKAQLFIKKPSHALIVSGPAGSRKYSLATHLAGSVLEVESDQLVDYPYFAHLKPEDNKNSIGIEAIRELDHFFSLKVPIDKPYNRVLIIEGAEVLTQEAQNALLKLLEEPPDRSLLILATNSEQALLPTIRSRAQNLAVIRPEAEATINFFNSQGYKSEDTKRSYAISGGLPGLMNALLSDDDHPMRQATDRARQLLSQSAYERLLLVDELAKNRQLAIDTAFILQQMARVSLKTAHGKAAQKWQNVLNAGYAAEEALTNSAQPKLALTNLMLSL